MPRQLSCAAHGLQLDCGTRFLPSRKQKSRQAAVVPCRSNFCTSRFRCFRLSQVTFRSLHTQQSSRWLVIWTVIPQRWQQSSLHLQCFAVIRLCPTGHVLHPESQLHLLPFWRTFCPKRRTSLRLPRPCNSAARSVQAGNCAVNLQRQSQNHREYS